MERVVIGDSVLYCDDCLDIMPTLREGDINAIYTDPPYYRIKGAFDFEFNDFEEFKDLIDSCAKEWKRLLPKNGSLYVFGHAKIIAYKQIILDKYFNLENSLVWNSLDRQTRRGVDVFRCYPPVTERCLFYSNEVERTGLEEIKLDIDNFKPLRNYFRDLQGFIGSGSAKIHEALGHTKADHCFRWASTQWDMPTAETYSEIESAFSCKSWADWQEYEALRQEYEALRQEYEALRRPFNNSLKLTDVINHSQESNISSKYDHDTIKPLGLMEKLIITSTNKNDTVLDCFMGSGTTGVAALNLGRKFIGIEKNKKHFDLACERIKASQSQMRLVI